jgi:hypothetical protein
VTIPNRSLLFTHPFTCNMLSFTKLHEGNSLPQKSERNSATPCFYWSDCSSLTSEQTLFVHHGVNGAVHQVFTLSSTEARQARL